MAEIINRHYKKLLLKVISSLFYFHMTELKAVTDAVLSLSESINDFVIMSPHFGKAKYQIAQRSTLALN